MAETAKPTALLCVHCGASAGKDPILQDGLVFCCAGCNTVYDILNQNGLCEYYSISGASGNSFKLVKEAKNTIEELDMMESGFSVYADEDRSVVQLRVPSMHCSSCIWLLERLGKLDKGVAESRVNFHAKEIRITFLRSKTSFGQIVYLLRSLGYEPSLLPADDRKLEKDQNRESLVKLGVAGFCAGNTMMFSFPQYFGLKLEQDSDLAALFVVCNVVLSIPLVFYCASGYFAAFYRWITWKGISVKVPLALGIGTLWLRSIFEVSTGLGGGYFDSLAGLVFFLLLGAWLQNRTFESLRFGEKTKNFFPLVARTVVAGKIIPKRVAELTVGERLQISHGEIIPVDGILMGSHAHIDYSFATGESVPVHKVAGEILFAGGRNTNATFEMETIRTFSDSHLADMWQNSGTTNEPENKIARYEAIISRYFIASAVFLALAALVFWLPTNPARAWFAFTAVLMVACPCALSLAPPFAFNIASSFFAKKGIFLKKPAAISVLGEAKNVVFDKTGTLTAGENHKAIIPETYTEYEKKFLASLCQQSLHPYSVSISTALQNTLLLEVKEYREIPGSGIEGWISGQRIRVGSRKWVCGEEETEGEKCIYFSIENRELNPIKIHDNYHNNLAEYLNNLKSLGLDLHLASGDIIAKKDSLIAETGNVFSTLFFNQKPNEKLQKIRALKEGGTTVMVGDGLNDAAALKEADAGLVVAESANTFTPEASGILLQKNIQHLPMLFRISKRANGIVKETFAISLVYNIVAVGLAMSGKMSPLFAAIAMPLSAIVMMLFAWSRTTLLVRKEEQK